MMGERWWSMGVGPVTVNSKFQGKNKEENIASITSPS